MLWRWNWINGSWLGSCWLKRRNKGVELVGPNGLLNQLTKNVLETALDAEVTERLGYDKRRARQREVAS
jgi:transposase-like protein